MFKKESNNMKKVLEIGAGNNPYKSNEGEVITTLDIIKLENVDIVHDLNDTPFPFKDNSFDVVMASHVLEHLDNYTICLKELKRILKTKGKIIIKVPYFASPCAFSDPTHKHYFTIDTFKYFDVYNEIGKNYNHEVLGINFRLIENSLIFQDRIRFKLGKLIYKLNPYFYETHISRIIPAKELSVILEKE